MTGSQNLSREEWKKMAQELDVKLLDILTSDQSAQLEKMKGAKVDIGSSSFSLGGGGYSNAQGGSVGEGGEN